MKLQEAFDALRADGLVIGPDVQRCTTRTSHPSNRIDELLPWAVAAKWADDTKVRQLPQAA